MNEAEKILNAELKHFQGRIKDMKEDLKCRNEAIKNYEKNIKEILEALMVLEGEKG